MKQEYIETPKGKRMTARQYLALRRAHAMKNYTGLALDCEEGHAGCACWLGGPCTNRVEEMVSRPTGAGENQK